jgi:hypothetical protein
MFNLKLPAKDYYHVIIQILHLGMQAVCWLDMEIKCYFSICHFALYL